MHGGVNNMVLARSHVASSECPGLSVVVPLFNEEENVDAAVEEILGVLDRIPGTAEVLLVDDGSRDATGELALQWCRRDERVRVVQFRRNFGQTAAISAGFEFARGSAVVVMDGDQQNDPADIPMLLEELAKGFDIVSGWRTNRQDKLLLRRLPSKLANALISRVTGTQLHDYGCTLKAYDAEVVRNLRLYGELHRFIPAVAAASGARINEVPVNHRPRARGSSKYGISRAPRVLLDLITVKFLISYVARPMQFFGRLALVAAGGSLLTALARHDVRGDLHRRGLSVVVCTQLLSAGLLGELLTRVYFEARASRPYAVRQLVGIAEPAERAWPGLVVADMGERGLEPLVGSPA